MLVKRAASAVAVGSHVVRRARALASLQTVPSPLSDVPSDLLAQSNLSIPLPPRSLLPATFLPITHGQPAALLHLRSHHLPLLTIFLHFAAHAAHSLAIPLSRPAALPTQRTLWTVPRSPFVHKKSQENFERKVHKRVLKAWDANPEVVQVWWEYLKRHELGGVGMRMVWWTRMELPVKTRRVISLRRRFLERRERMEKKKLEEEKLKALGGGEDENGIVATKSKSKPAPTTTTAKTQTQSKTTDKPKKGKKSKEVSPATAALLKATAERRKAKKLKAAKRMAEKEILRMKRPDLTGYSEEVVREYVQRALGGKLRTKVQRDLFSMTENLKKELLAVVDWEKVRRHSEVVKKGQKSNGTEEGKGEVMMFAKPSGTIGESKDVDGPSEQVPDGSDKSSGEPKALENQTLNSNPDNNDDSTKA